jgi:hypothetical protein
MPDDATEFFQARLVLGAEDQIDGTRVGIEKNDGIFS